jgi:hypothetical protein
MFDADIPVVNIGSNLLSTSSRCKVEHATPSDLIGPPQKLGAAFLCAVIIESRSDLAPHIGALPASGTALPLPGTPRLKFTFAARTDARCCFPVRFLTLNEAILRQLSARMAASN